MKSRKSCATFISTGILSSFTERLKQGVSSCTAAYQNTLSHCAALLHTIQTEAGSPLACSITADIPDFSAVLSLLSDQNQTDKAALEKTTEQLRSAAAAYDCINLELAKTENDLLAQYRKAAKEFAEMECQNEEWAKRRKTLELLEKAAPVAQKEQECLSLSDEIVRLKTSIKSSESMHALHKKKLYSIQTEQKEAERSGRFGAQKQRTDSNAKNAASKAYRALGKAERMHFFV